MKQIYTERQQQFVDMAAKHADSFAERADKHDRDNTFPFENYDEMRESGFLTLSIPEELGGLGANQYEILPAIERLAQGDAATALAVTMHISPLGQWSAVWQRTKMDSLEKILRRAVDGDLVWAAITSEIGTPNLMTDARTTATKVDGGFVLNGRKNFGTNSSAATHCSTTARYEDPELGPRLLLLQLDLKADGVTIIPVWDMLGMRATQSNDIELVDVFVPDEAVVHHLPVGHLDSRVMETVFAWAQPAFGAVYNGIAAGALEWACRQAVRRGLTNDKMVQNSIAECEILLEQSRAALYRHADDVSTGRLKEQLTVQEALSRCAFVKYVCTNNAVEIMNKLVEVVGGAAYVRKLPFQRLWRDCQAGLFMPFSNYASRELIGATALGVEMAPTHIAENVEPLTKI